MFVIASLLYEYDRLLKVQIIEFVCVSPKATFPSKNVNITRDVYYTASYV